MDVRFYRESLAHHGLGPTLFHTAYRAANALAPLSVWNALAITLAQVDPKFLRDPKRAGGTWLPAEAMRRHVSDPANLLTPAFIDEAAAKGDRCFAMFEREKLTSYGWYATKPTRLTEVAPELVLSFDPAWAYMYHGFTHPEHRGQRLHAIGMAAALEELTREGLSGLVSYVDSANFSSLKSCARMGYRTFGHVVLLKVRGHYAIQSSPGCRKYGFRVDDTSISSNAS